MARVAVLMASRIYQDRMRSATTLLTELGVPVDELILSAHRTPEQTAEFARGARQSGYRVLICGASQAAHLAGLAAAHTDLPVIGVPLAGGPLNGFDSLLSTVQMPNGYPVATVAIDNARNAGILAAQILALADPSLQQRLAQQRARSRTPAPPTGPA